MKTTIRKTFKYRLYRCDKQDTYLHDKINVAGMVWNHALALQKRYYKLTGKFISKYTMQKHIGKLRSKSPKFAYWKKLGSQTTQLITHKLDDAYQRFFKGLAKRPPKFRKVKNYRSITYTQAGWKLVGDNQLWIEGRVYKFVKHRELEDAIKTITIKRDGCNRFWVCFSVECEVEIPQRVMTGKSAGLDFGLKTFLTDDTGKTYQSPEFLRQEIADIRKLSRAYSRKQAGSKHRKRAKYDLSRAQIRIADKRTDSHYKLAHQLCEQFDTIYLEDLHIDAMKRLWGRKVSDLAFSEFVRVLKWIAKKHGVEVVFIDRFDPTTKMCSHCGRIQDISLHQRTYDCECGLALDRDHNAAKNIKRIGASIPLPEACQTGACSCLVVDGRSLCL